MRRQQDARNMVSAANGKFSTCSQLLRQAESLKTQITGKTLEATDVTKEEFLTRQGLQLAFKKLLLTDVNFALDKKVDLELWNNAFKCHIDALRRQVKESKGSSKSEIQAKLSCFIDASIGFYIQLLQEFCDIHDIDLPWRVPSSQLGIEKVSSSENKDHVERRLCLYVCQDCLVHLGDLARYRGDIIQAQSFYVEASTIVPINGQPYNQLAILATAKGDNLAAVFYYCKSIAVRNQFPAATSNLQTAFYQLCSQSRSRSQFKSGSFTKEEFIVAILLYFGKLYLLKELDMVAALTEKLLRDFEEILEDFEAAELLYCVGILIFIVYSFKSKPGQAQTNEMPAESTTEALASVLSFALEWFMCILRAAQLQLMEMKGNESTCSSDVLCCLKVLTDWLLSNPTVLAPLGDSSLLIDFWSAFADFSNTVKNLSSSKDHSHWPLPEDSLFQGFLPLRKAHRKIDFHATCPSKITSLISSTRLSRMSHSFDLLSHHPKLNRYFSKEVTGDTVEFVCSAVKTEADLHAPSTDKEMDLAVRKLFDSLPTLAKPTIHERSKSPFSETRSLFGVTSEEKGNDSVIRKEPKANGIPGQVPSYSLFDSTWSIHLNQSPAAQAAATDMRNVNLPSPNATPAASLHSPGSLLFPSSQDSDSSFGAPGAPLPHQESKPLPVSHIPPQTLFSSSSSSLVPSSGSELSSNTPVSSMPFPQFQDPCIVTQVPYQVQDEKHVPPPMATSSRYIPPAKGTVNGFGPIGQSPTNYPRTVLPQHMVQPQPPMPPVGGWRFSGGGLPRGGATPFQPAQSIWGSGFGFGQGALSPLEQLLEEQRMRGQPPS